jgi:hypothetical protein
VIELRCSYTEFDECGKTIWKKKIDLNIASSDTPPTLEISIPTKKKTRYQSVLIPINELLYRLEQRGMINISKSYRLRTTKR